MAAKKKALHIPRTNERKSEPVSGSKSVPGSVLDPSESARRFSENFLTAPVEEPPPPPPDPFREKSKTAGTTRAPRWPWCTPPGARHELSKLSVEEQQALSSLWQSRRTAEVPAAVLDRLIALGLVLRVGSFTLEEGLETFKLIEPAEWSVSLEGMRYLVREGFVKQVYADATSGGFEVVSRPEGP